MSKVNEAFLEKYVAMPKVLQIMWGILIIITAIPTLTIIAILAATLVFDKKED